MLEARAAVRGDDEQLRLFFARHLEDSSDRVSVHHSRAVGNRGERRVFRDPRPQRLVGRLLGLEPRLGAEELRRRIVRVERIRGRRSLDDVAENDLRPVSVAIRNAYGIAASPASEKSVVTRMRLKFSCMAFTSDCELRALPIPA